MEKLMRESCLNNDGHEYEALRLTHIFWRIYDFIYKSNRADIFKHLYLSPKHLKDSYLKISNDHNVTVRTLERYRKIFVMSFEIALSLLKTNEIILMAA